MTRASAINNESWIKHEWPGNPEMITSQIWIRPTGTDTEARRIRIIDSVTFIDGEHIDFTEPPIIPGWVIEDRPILDPAQIEARSDQ